MQTFFGVTLGLICIGSLVFVVLYGHVKHRKQTNQSTRRGARAPLP